jgi:CheY-like chemotaxis protein
MKLSGVSTLIVDADHFGSMLVQQMLRGLGMDRLIAVTTGAQALAELKQQPFDLCIFDASLQDMAVTALISNIRLRKTPVRFVPILVVSPYTYTRTVTQARDVGANFVIKKPVSPQILYDRIAWAASSARPFLEGEFYIGPDRRFKFAGPPAGVGRRDSDLPAEIGDAVEPNMSQEEIDAMIKPTKVVQV